MNLHLFSLIFVKYNKSVLRTFLIFLMYGVTTFIRLHLAASNSCICADVGVAIYIVYIYISAFATKTQDNVNDMPQQTRNNDYR